MPRQFLLGLSVLALILVLSLAHLINNHTGQSSGMMGHPGMTQSRDAQTIHQLFANHNQIHRTVTEIPGGIRAVTESDNPQIAALIQAHVSNMYDRVNQQRSIPMIGMSSTLPTMLRSANQYQRQLHLTLKGIEVIETATNPQMIAVIRDHAQEVTRFVAQGMPAMMNGRMR